MLVRMSKVQSPRSKVENKGSKYSSGSWLVVSGHQERQLPVFDPEAQTRREGGVRTAAAVAKVVGNEEIARVFDLAVRRRTPDSRLIQSGRRPAGSRRDPSRPGGTGLGFCIRARTRPSETHDRRVLSPAAADLRPAFRRGLRRTHRNGYPQSSRGSSTGVQCLPGASVFLKEGGASA